MENKWIGMALREVIRKRVNLVVFQNEEVRQKALFMGKLIDIANVAYEPELGSYSDFMAKAVYLLLTDPTIQK